MAGQQMPVRVRKPLLKQGRNWRSKRDVMSQIRRIRGLGSFHASLCWQIYRGQCKTFPKDAEKSYCETGPGARAGVNWLLGFPPQLGKGSRDRHTGDFYAQHLINLHAYVSRRPVLREDAGDSEAVCRLKSLLRDYLTTLEGRAFLACEHSKFVWTLLHVSRN